MVPKRYWTTLHRIETFPWGWMVSIAFLPTLSAGLVEGGSVVMFKTSSPWLPLWAGIAGSLVSLLIMVSVKWSESVSVPDEVVTVQDILDDVGARSFSSLTSLQADAMRNVWKGKRFIASGKIDTVADDSSEKIHRVGGGDNEVRVVLRGGGEKNFRFLYVTFHPDPWKETMKRMNQRDTLTVSGEIVDIDRGDIMLTKGDVVSHTHAWRIPFLTD